VGEFSRHGSSYATGVAAAVVFSAIVGSVSFTGSLVTFAKLQALMTGRPVTFPGQQYAGIGLLATIVGLGIGVLTSASTPLLVVLKLLALVMGVLFVLPVGG